MSAVNFKDFIFLLSKQIFPESISITNIKISFLCNKKAEINNDVCISYYKCYNLIVKYDNYTYTFLGKNKSHLNITGINSILNVETAIIGLTRFSNLQLSNFKNFNVDNISSTFKTHPGLKEILLNINQVDFRIFKPCRFCGIIIKYKNCSLTYFNSGSVILVGLKNVHELNLYVKKYKTFFDHCKIFEKNVL